MPLFASSSAATSLGRPDIDSWLRMGGSPEPASWSWSPCSSAGVTLGRRWEAVLEVERTGDGLLVPEICRAREVVVWLLVGRMPERLLPARDCRCGVCLVEGEIGGVVLAPQPSCILFAWSPRRELKTCG